MKHRLYCLLASTLGPLVVKLLCHFVRFEFEGWEHVEALRAARRPHVFALWHSRLLYLCYLPRTRGMVALVTRNKDGEYIARVMRGFNHDAVRGSTSRGGGAALRDLVRRVRGGQIAGVTVDGPRGPAEVVQGGIIELASLAGAAILPITWFCHPVWRIKSWDRFLVPRGYGRGIILIGAPIEVPSPCPREALEEKRVQLERAMRTLTAQAEHYWDQNRVEVSQG